MAEQTNTVDWSATCTRYLARSAGLEARSLQLFQSVLEGISRGRLRPTVFQDHYPVFAAAHGPAFSRRFAEASSRFLGEMTRLGANFGRPANAEGPAVETPRFDASNPARWFEELAAYAGRLAARANEDFRARLDRVAAGELTPTEVQKEAADRAARGLPEFLQAMTLAYFEFLDEMAEIRSACEETYFQGLMAGAREEGSEPAVALVLSGQAGSTVSASVWVTNTTGQSARVLRRLGDARRSDGVGPSLVPEISFEPEILELAPDEEKALELRLFLDPAVYDLGAVYAGALRLSGASEVPLDLELRIRAVPAPAPEAAAGPNR